VIRRHRRVLPSIVVASVLLAVGVLFAVSGAQLVLDRTPVLPVDGVRELGGRVTWQHPLLIGAEVLVGLVGLLLIGAALLPGRPTVLPLAPAHGLVSGTTRSGLARALATTAREVDGVDSARLRVGTRRVRATVRTPLHDAAGLAEQVRAALRDRLSDLDLTRRPTVRVRVITSKDPR
jgi:hypothetical protein